MKKICIITTLHISYNPRVLKEADAFYKKGFDVVVVTINGNETLSRFDQKIMANRKWKLKTANFRKADRFERFNWIWFTTIHLFFTWLAKFTYKFGIAEKSAIKGYYKLLKLAKSEKADLYIVHHAEALAVGFRAAKCAAAELGFDAEDFQAGMYETGKADNKNKLILYLENKYLKHYQYFTAASKGIGDLYQKKYRVGPFHTILNVFPKEAVPYQHTKPLKFYWYSQVIGPNRSLEKLFFAAAKIDKEFELHLRGKFHSKLYEKSLRQLVIELGIHEKVYFHSPILADNIITDAAKYDIGLALESNVSINRNICVTNKIFSYLMSGLGIIGTDTDGQQDIFKHFSSAVRICKKDDEDELRSAMLYFINNPSQVILAKQAARKAALERFNWEYESELLLSVFANKCRRQAAILS